MAAWLIMVGRNVTVDHVRRQSRLTELPDEGLVADPEHGDVEADWAERLDDAHYRDDILRLLFTCCHPDLPATQQIALALRVVSGLSVAQMANSLRTLVAGVTVGNWRAPDDQTYDVNVRLAPEARTAPQDPERLPFAVTAADGATRIVRLNQVASVTESTGANQIILGEWWPSVFPGIAISLTVFGFAVLGNALERRYDAS